MMNLVKSFEYVHKRDEYDWTGWAGCLNNVLSSVRYKGGGRKEGRKKEGWKRRRGE
jgi:hypothetical protein